MTTNPTGRLGLVILSLLLPIHGEEPALRDLLRDALYTEEVTRDPEQAAKQYEDLLSRHNEQKQFAASALFRLAEVRRKQDRKEDAIQLYQRLITEFPGAETETKLAKENLAALGGKMPAADAAVPDAEAAELARLEGLVDTSPDILLDQETLLKAVEDNQAKVVKYLLGKGSKPYDEPLYGEALNSAVEQGNLEIVKLLTDGDVLVPEQAASDAILAAILSDRHTVLEFLLNKGFKPGMTASDFGEVPIFVRAVLEDKLRGAEILLQHGADVNAMVDAKPGKPGDQFSPCGTALHLVLSRSLFDRAAWLLEKGAKPDLPDPYYGFTPLHYAAMSEYPEAPAMIAKLLDAGADPNRRCNDRMGSIVFNRAFLRSSTPLETAILFSGAKSEKIRLLLKHGAKPAAEGSKIAGALAMMIRIDDPSVPDLVEILAAAGFPMRDPELLSNATLKGNWKVIELLLKYGADPNTKDRDGNTFLAAACIAGDADRVQLLLKNGADPKQPGLLGQLIRRGPEAVPMIQILFEAGADPNAVDDTRQPPIVDLFDWNFENKNSGNVYLHSDKRSDQAKLLELLLTHGLDPNTTYGEFVRSATSSSVPNRSGGNAGSPFLEDTTETKTFPKSLLMMVVEMEKSRKVKNVDMIGMLLDAGAKPTHEFPEVFDFVAKGDDSLPIAKALLPFRPKILNLERTGYFLNWSPMVRRLFLDDLLNPAVRARGGVSLVLADVGGCYQLLAPGVTVPDSAHLLWENAEKLTNLCGGFPGKAYLPKLTRLRREEQDEWIRTVMDIMGSGELPDLRQGDLIELERVEEVSTSDHFAGPGVVPQESSFAKLMQWNLRKRVAFPVTIEISGKPREIKLRGDLLSYDPTKNEAPLLAAGRLAMLFLPLSKDLGTEGVEPNSILTVRRKDGGETRMDLSASGAAEFQLKPGDYLILPEPGNVVKSLKSWLRPVLLKVPGIAGARVFGPLSDTSISGKPALPMPTLVQVLTDAYSPWRPWKGSSDDTSMESSFPEISGWVQGGSVPVIVPHPDFSRIRITRTFEAGKEEILEVDLSKFIDECHEDTPDAEAKKADVMLFPGDVVELPLKEARGEQPWNGFTEAEERFFRKVLGGKLLTRKQDGIIESIAISYHQPDWKKTAHGLIPIPPKHGVSTTRLHDLSQKNGRGVNLKREGIIFQISSNDPLVRGGDEIDLSVRSPQVVIPPMPTPMQPVQQPRMPRSRVTPLPSSN